MPRCRIVIPSFGRQTNAVYNALVDLQSDLEWRLADHDYWLTQPPEARIEAVMEARLEFQRAIDLLDLRIREWAAKETTR